MRQLLPVPLDSVDPATVYADLPSAAGRPAVRVNMIASVDGATAVSATSGDLSGRADRQLFSTLRSLCDVILVGAGTVRAEHYGPAKLPPAARDARRERGQVPAPTIAVVTRSCRLDWDTPLFAASEVRPIVITVAEAPPDRRARAAEVADIVVAGQQDIVLARAVDALGDRGARHVLTEGGPTLNGQLAVESLIDEMCLTVSPMLVGGEAKRVLSGLGLSPPTAVRVVSLCEEDGYLFLRVRPS